MTWDSANNQWVAGPQKVMDGTIGFDPAASAADRAEYFRTRAALDAMVVPYTRRGPRKFLDKYVLTNTRRRAQVEGLYPMAATAIDQLWR